MNLAIIDMGTNTFHLLLVKVENESFEIFHKEKIAAKIGAKGINQRNINNYYEYQKRKLARVS